MRPYNANIDKHQTFANSILSLPNRQPVQTIQSLTGDRDGGAGMVPSNVTQVRFWPAAIHCWSLLALALPFSLGKGSCVCKIEWAIPPSTKINMSNFHFNQDRGVAHEIPAQAVVAFS